MLRGKNTINISTQLRTQCNCHNSTSTSTIHSDSKSKPLSRFRTLDLASLRSFDEPRSLEPRMCQPCGTSIAYRSPNSPLLHIRPHIPTPRLHSPQVFVTVRSRSAENSHRVLHTLLLPFAQLFISGPISSACLDSRNSLGKRRARGLW
jgi:hypothetical protein